MFHRHEDAGDGHAGQSLFGHRDWEKVTGHVVDIMTDGRNSWKAQNAKMEALKERLVEDDEPADEDSVTGPPWAVPAHCPTCGAAVNKAKASMDLEPQCGYCHQPLPVQPRARF